MGWGVFKRATTANALKVLDEAIAVHGVPLSILSDHGSTFCDNESGGRARGGDKFEKRLGDLRIRRILARVNHPQTNGKLERLRGEAGSRPHLFEGASAGRTTRVSVGGGPAHVGGPSHAAPAADPLDRFFEMVQQRQAKHST